MNIYTYMHAVPTTSVQVSSSHIHIQIDTSKIHRVRAAVDIYNVQTISLHWCS